MHLCDIIRKLTSDRLVVECFVAFFFKCSYLVLDNPINTVGFPLLGQRARMSNDVGVRSTLIRLQSNKTAPSNNSQNLL